MPNDDYNYPDDDMIDDLSMDDELEIEDDLNDVDPDIDISGLDLEDDDLEGFSQIDLNNPPTIPDDDMDDLVIPPVIDDIDPDELDEFDLDDFEIDESELDKIKDEELDDKLD